MFWVRGAFYSDVGKLCLRVALTIRVNIEANIKMSEECRTPHCKWGALTASCLWQPTSLTVVTQALVVTAIMCSFIAPLFFVCLISTQFQPRYLCSYDRLASLRDNRHGVENKSRRPTLFLFTRTVCTRDLMISLDQSFHWLIGSTWYWLYCVGTMLWALWRHVTSRFAATVP